jgi:predicted amidohydrolase
VWADPDLDGLSLYSSDPVLELIHRGAQILINLSASPFELGKAAERRELIRRYAADSGRFFVYANQVGGNDELVFDGHSLIFDGRGQVVARARDFAEDLLVYDVPDAALSGAKGAAAPRRRSTPKRWPRSSSVCATMFSSAGSTAFCSVFRAVSIRH